MASSSFIEVENVRQWFGQHPGITMVLHEINLRIDPGELVLLMGPSGSGKTTLITLMAGLIQPSQGSVTLLGQKLPYNDNGQMATNIRRSGIWFIFQHYNLFRALTAIDNIIEVLKMKGFSSRKARVLAEQSLEEVGLSHRLKHYPAQMSGGEQQRVAIARSLAGDPKFIIGDEPTAALDTKNGLKVTKLMMERAHRGKGVLLVTHDYRLEKYADRIIRITDGKIISDERPTHDYKKLASQ